MSKGSVFLIVLLVYSGTLFGASTGALDRSFGDRGVVTASIGNDNWNFPIDHVIDDQGRILTVSRITENNVPKLLFNRFLGDGSVNESFGTNGRVTVVPDDGGGTRYVPFSMTLDATADVRLTQR